MGSFRARGLPHYWIVDPDARTFECYRLEGDAYRLDASGTAQDHLAVAAFRGFVIPLADLWLE